MVLTALSVLKRLQGRYSHLMLVFYNEDICKRSGRSSAFSLSNRVIPTYVLFGSCQDCQEIREDETMSCIPPSAFHAKDIRESLNKDLTKASNEEPRSFKHQFNEIAKELNPLQYNSKMMNSIWGLYNRYSSHNVKTNNDVCSQYCQDLQPATASPKNDSVLNISPKMKWDNVWASFNFSQSH